MLCKLYFDAYCSIPSLLLFMNVTYLMFWSLKVTYILAKWPVMFSCWSFLNQVHMVFQYCFCPGSWYACVCVCVCVCVCALVCACAYMHKCVFCVYTHAWFACVHMCVCPLHGLLITVSALWHDMEPIWLVKQVLQLLCSCCSQYHWYRYSLRFRTCHKNLLNNTKLVLYKQFLLP